MLETLLKIAAMTNPHLMAFEVGKLILKKAIKSRKPTRELLQEKEVRLLQEIIPDHEISQLKEDFDGDSILDDLYD